MKKKTPLIDQLKKDKDLFEFKDGKPPIGVDTGEEHEKPKPVINQNILQPGQPGYDPDKDPTIPDSFKKAMQNFKMNKSIDFDDWNTEI